MVKDNAIVSFQSKNSRKWTSLFDHNAMSLKGDGWMTTVLPVQLFLCPYLPKAAVGHIAFSHDVTSVHAFVTFLTRVQQMFVYIQIYIDIYVSVSLGGHTLDTFYARKLKFGMILTQM